MTLIIVETINGFLVTLRNTAINSNCYVGHFGSEEKAEKAGHAHADFINVNITGKRMSTTSTFSPNF